MPKEIPPKGSDVVAVGIPASEPISTVVVSPSQIDEVKEDLESKLTDAQGQLEKVLKEQKAKGEISAASESTMQALMEQIKALNANMEVVKKLEERMNLAPLRIERKWWEDLLPW